MERHKANAEGEIYARPVHDVTGLTRKVARCEGWQIFIYVPTN